MSIQVIFVHTDGRETVLSGDEGMSILQLAQENGIEMEGACEGNMACSTCHVVVDKAFFPLLAEATEDEEEMLDLASGLKATSRLGCQITLASNLNGLRLYLPAETRNVLGF
jgi:ferredoxin